MYSVSPGLDVSRLNQLNRLAFLSIVPLLFVFCTGQIFGQTAAVLPEAPRVTVDVSLPAITGRVIAVPAGGDFQAALNIAQFGDVIELQAGATYVGEYSLPNKTGNGWITIRTSAGASLPAPGTRVTPAQAGLMAKILCPGSAGKSIKTLPGAHHYRIIGLEMAPQTSGADVRNIVW